MNIALRRKVAMILGASLALVSLAPAAQAATPTATCDGRTATIVGTEGADTLTGTNGNDVIVGLGGNDTIRPGNGDDLVCAGDGDDDIDGGNGNDRVFAGSGKDILVGGNGLDLCGAAETNIRCETVTNETPPLSANLTVTNECRPSLTLDATTEQDRASNGAPIAYDVVVRNDPTGACLQTNTPATVSAVAHLTSTLTHDEQIASTAVWLELPAVAGEYPRRPGYRRPEHRRLRRGQRLPRRHDRRLRLDYRQHRRVRRVPAGHHPVPDGRRNARHPVSPLPDARRR